VTSAGGRSIEAAEPSGSAEARLDAVLARLKAVTADARGPAFDRAEADYLALRRRLRADPGLALEADFRRDLAGLEGRVRELAPH
jgi:hypothetical protein